MRGLPWCATNSGGGNTEWHDHSYDWRDMAIIYVAGYQGKAISQALCAANIPCLWMASKDYKKACDPAVDRVTVLTLQSSKGLEFPMVVLVGRLFNIAVKRALLI